MAFTGKLTRRTFLALSAAGIMGFAGLASAAPTAGRDYQVLGNPQLTDAPGKIEVAEFFSYACPHCADLEPQFAAWIKRQGNDVVVRRVPITFGRDQWVPLAKLYYALDMLGKTESMNTAVFNAIHKENRNFTDEKVQLDWLVKQGVDKTAYQGAYNSFSMSSKVQRAQQVAAAYRVSGVPAVAVDGKYMTSVSMANGFENFFATLDTLVAKARAEKGRK